MRAAAALAICLVAVFPSAASAATLVPSGANIDYSAAVGEDNDLTISRDGAEYVFTDAVGITITPTAPCTATANIGRCPVTSVQNIDARLGDLDDTGRLANSLVGPRLSSPTIFGGDGNDALFGGDNIDGSLRGDGGIDVVTGGAGDEFASGDDGPDVLVAGAGDDRLSPGFDTANDQMHGGPGDDEFEPRTRRPDGGDVFAGGPGEDRLNLQERYAGMNISLNGVPDDGSGCPGAGCEGDDVDPDIEFIIATEGNDVVVGTVGPQRIQGNAGDDSIEGGPGDDDVSGSDDEDVVSGGAGNDDVDGSQGADQVSGGPGDDFLDASELEDGGADVFSGGSGYDESSGGFSFMPSPLRIDLDGQPDDGPTRASFEGPLDNMLGDVEGFEGGPLADVLIGNGAANAIVGGAGRDRIIGAGGSDGIEGGRGGDRLIGGKGADLLEGEGGADQIRSRGGGRDQISCGSAKDAVKADRADRIDADCDRVRR